MRRDQLALLSLRRSETRFRRRAVHFLKIVGQGLVRLGNSLRVRRAPPRDHALNKCSFCSCRQLPGRVHRAHCLFREKPDWFDREPDWFDREPDRFDREPDWFDREPDRFDRATGLVEQVDDHLGLVAGLFGREPAFVICKRACDVRGRTFFAGSGCDASCTVPVGNGTVRGISGIVSLSSGRRPGARRGGPVSSGSVTFQRKERRSQIA